MTKVLSLTAKDLDVTDEELCNFLGNKDCSTPVTLPSTPATTSKPVASSSAAVTTPTTAITKPATTVTTPATTAAAPVPPPALVIDFDSFDGTVPIFDLKATDKLPERLTCHGILAAGTAASALKAKDLESWSSKQILNCIEVLGSIELSRETKKEIWNLIQSKMVSIHTQLSGAVAICHYKCTVLNVRKPDSSKFRTTLKPHSQMSEIQTNWEKN